jgi:NAD-dependent deacetylase
MEDLMVTDEEITRVAKDIVRSKKTVALSGAGMSVESGIPPFRGKGGIWEKYDPEEYGNIATLHRAPEKAWTLFREMERGIISAKPNAGHYALAELEKMDFLRTIITQNVDGLHHLAGSKDIIEFHGNMQWVVCLGCGDRLRSTEIPLEDIPPRCKKCNAVYKPDAVLFGEAIPPDALTRAHQESRTCSLMLVIGTTATVYPAASMPEAAKAARARIVEINPSETPLTQFISDYIVKGTVVEVLPKVVEKVKADGAMLAL